MILPRRNKITKEIHIVIHKYQQNISLKPDGIWYSCGNSWYTWIIEENMTEFLYKYIHKVNIPNDAITNIKNKNKNKLLVIKNINDFDIFNKKYGIIQNSGSTVNQYIDWISVSKDYGGIEICPLIRSRTNYTWYSTWDVASGCVWNIQPIVKKIELIYEKKKGQYVKYRAKK